MPGRLAVDRFHIDIGHGEVEPRFSRRAGCAYLLASCSRRQSYSDRVRFVGFARTYPHCEVDCWFPVMEVVRGVLVQTVKSASLVMSHT